MNFKEYIDKDIEEKKVLLELLPLNTEARVKKYKDTVNEIISNYQNTLVNVRNFIDYKYEKLLPNKLDRDPQIKAKNDQINSVKQNIIETNPNTSFYEKLGLDMLIFDLEHYYNYSLNENNETIKKLVSKFKDAGITLSCLDFKLNLFSYNYMVYFFELNEGKNIDIEIYKKLFWKCPKVYENIIVCFRMLIKKYEKKLDSFAKSNDMKILHNGGFKGREELINRLYSLESEKKALENKDEADLILDFMSGELDFSVYSNTMSNLYGELDYFLINPIDTSNQSVLDHTINVIDIFYNNLLEYQKYSINEPLFENIVNLYNKSIISVDLKQLLKDYKAQMKKINKLQGTAKKAFINKKLTIDNIDKIPDGEMNKCIEQQKVISDIYNEYCKMDNMYFNIVLKKNIQTNSFISAIIEIVVNYPFFSRSLIKSVFELETNEEVTDKYNELFDMSYNSFRKLIDMKSIFSKENFEVRLMDSYRLDNLNINDTTFEEDNQALAISNYEKLKNKMKIAKFSHSLEEIEFLINIKKLKDSEQES